MAASTVSGIVDYVRLRTDHTALSDVQMMELVNDALRWIQRASPIIWQATSATQTVATVTGDLQTWNVPTDAKAIHHFFAVISGEHRPVTPAQGQFGVLVNQFSGATAGMEPLYWTVYGARGYLFPPLSSALSADVFFERMLPDFTSPSGVANAGTGTNEILSVAPEVLEYASVAEYYDGISETVKANIYRQKAAAALERLVKAQRGLAEESRSMVPSTPGQIRGKRPALWRVQDG